MRPEVECPRCRTTVAATAPYCVACGAQMPRRGSSVVVPGEQEGDARMTQALVNATAGKRLLAKIMDSVPPSLIMMIFLGIGISSISTTQTSAAYTTLDLTLFLVMAGIGMLLTLGYGIWMWGWEARAGKTLGNLAMGIRTADEKGLPAGWGSIFVRNLIIGLSGIIPVAGFILIMISNLWDANHKRQGWHDRIARTLVFDVRKGRDPLLTGGAEGPSSFAPQQPPTPALQHIGSPVVTAAEAPATISTISAAAESVTTPQTTAPEPVPDRPRAVPLSQPTSVISSVPGFGPPPEPATEARTPDPAPAANQPETAPAPHPDDDVEATRVSSKAGTPHAPTDVAPVVLIFDDGNDVELAAEALIGRNPSSQDGDEAGQLIAVTDQGRSVSKTHLHLRRDGQSLWVTDLNSTNGTAISGADGVRTPVPGGQTLMAEAGSTVYFGDRSFVVGNA